MATSVPVFSLARMHADVDVVRPVERVLERGAFVLGPEVQAFEEAFAEYCGVTHCVGVASGTDALELALRALGVEEGDRVAVVANAGGYSPSAVRAVGAEPVWVDVDSRTLTMAPEAFESSLALSPSAVIVTHLYGQLADMTSLLAQARAAGMPLIEDCAQSHGARVGAQLAGSYGDIGCFSFYPTKNLGAVGDGGAIVTRDDTLATRARALRQYGWGRKYEVAIGGGRNSRLDEIQAAVLASKLPFLDGWNRERRELARGYSEGLQGMPLTLPPSLGEDYVAHLYVIRTSERDRLAAHLAAEGIATALHYPVADHRQPAYEVDTATHLPVTDSAVETVLTLPCYPGLRSATQEIVIEAVRGFYTGGHR